jgi:hypothetical protein
MRFETVRGFVTEKHLDRAISEVRRSYREISEVCVITQAVKEIQPSCEAAVSTAWWPKEGGDHRFLTGPNLHRLMFVFDQGDYSAARAMLPLPIVVYGD